MVRPARLLASLGGRLGSSRLWPLLVEVSLASGLGVANPSAVCCAVTWAPGEQRPLRGSPCLLGPLEAPRSPGQGRGGRVGLSGPQTDSKERPPTYSWSWRRAWKTENVGRAGASCRSRERPTTGGSSGDAFRGDEVSGCSATGCAGRPARETEGTGSPRASLSAPMILGGSDSGGPRGSLSAAGQSTFWSTVGFCSTHLILRTSPMATGAGHPGTQLSAGRHDGAHWKLRDWEIRPQGGDACSELL